MTDAPPRAELVRARLASHLLSDTAASPDGVVRTLGAVQAQNLAAAVMAVGVRTRGSSRATVESMFDGGGIVRSWTMRGTLHLVAAEDLGWMLSVTSARQRAGAARESAARGISEADFDRASETIADHVAENGPTTRAEALDALERAGIHTGDERGYRLLRDAAMRGLVAWGPLRGRQPQLVRVPPTGDLDRDETLARLLIRYVTGHGPVSVRDFAWWSGLTLTDARLARSVAGSRLEPVGEDQRLVLPGAWPPLPTRGASSVHLVPAWDEYVLGYRDRSLVLDDRFAARVSPSGNGVFLPTIVSRGRVVGTWRHRAERSRLVAEADPFVELTASEWRAFDVETARLARFAGLEPAASV